MIIKNVKQARKELEKIGCDSRGIKIMAPKFVFRVIKIKNVDSRAANILKQEMLAAGGEAGVKKGAISYEERTTDVLLSGTAKQLDIVSKKINYKLFGLDKISRRIRSEMR